MNSCDAMILKHMANSFYASGCNTCVIIWAVLQILIVVIFTILYYSTYLGSPATYIITFVPNVFTPVGAYAAVVTQQVFRDDPIGCSNFLSLPFLVFSLWFLIQNLIWFGDSGYGKLFPVEQKKFRFAIR
ncbi:MAG: hypothetical protein ACHP6H_06485 [Legionellales bacterium]